MSSSAFSTKLVSPRSVLDGPGAGHAEARHLVQLQQRRARSRVRASSCAEQRARRVGQQRRGGRSTTSSRPSVPTSEMPVVRRGRAERRAPARRRRGACLRHRSAPAGRRRRVRVGMFDHASPAGWAAWLPHAPGPPRRARPARPGSRRRPGAAAPGRAASRRPASPSARRAARPRRSRRGPARPAGRPCAACDRRCAMAIVVRPWTRLSSAFWISLSVSVSTDEVASSRIRMRGSISSARAIEMRWRSPPERAWPRSPTSES